MYILPPIPFSLRAESRYNVSHKTVLVSQIQKSKTPRCGGGGGGGGGGVVGDVVLVL